MKRIKITRCCPKKENLSAKRHEEIFSFITTALKEKTMIQMTLLSGVAQLIILQIFMTNYWGA